MLIDCYFFASVKIINIFVIVEILKFVNMNVKLRVLSAGVLFFIGHSAMAQKVKKTLLLPKRLMKLWLLVIEVQPRRQQQPPLLLLTAKRLKTDLMQTS